MLPFIAPVAPIARSSAIWISLIAAASGLSACGALNPFGSGGTTSVSSQPVTARAGEGATGAPGGGLGEAATNASGRPDVAPVGGDIATRNALFKVSSFDNLPGWQQDNLTEAWSAFRESCKALERKPNWKKLCTEVRRITDPKAGRALMEREFTLLTVQNTDRTREGDITGYYEPLLNGRSQKAGDFTVPVYGVPNDMYFLDLKTVPAPQRKGVATLRPNGRLLVPAQANELGAVKVDLRRFGQDTLDRRLRVRLEGDQGLPYYSRADIQRIGQIDAPVLAWVDDPVALYAMQVQGAGRIKLADGTVLRLQYADQNGQPFKPMQVAAQGNERVQTRGLTRGDQAEEPEQFDLAPPADAVEQAPASDEPVTRGVRKQAASADPQVSDAVKALLPTAPQAAAPKPAAPAAASAKAPAGQALMLTPQGLVPVSGTKGAKPDAAKAKAGQADVVDALLPAKGAAPARPAAGGNKPASAASNGVSATLLAQRAKALETDPSYVFFRVAPEQAQGAGPTGALGVPLTAGRSLAVDPRVMPLGYPVFLDAAGTERQQPRLQRLMFAQDTGGAIRGAVRADYFWGYGADAGRQARQTRHRGRMWVMVPHAEVAQLMSSKLVVRGIGGPASAPECLVPDDEFCSDAQALADEQAAISP
jgi:membrane-bound lytic murein transglycosylase A